MKAEFLKKAISDLESAQAALEQWVRPATPYLPSELQDTGEYLASVGRAMKKIEAAMDEVLMAREKAAALLEPMIKKDPGEATAAPSPSDEDDEDEE